MDRQYSVEDFDVHGSRDYPSDLPVVRVEPEGWVWGSCTSETCNHVSHDPRTAGPRIFVRCQALGQDDGGRERFALPDGRVFRMCYRSIGRHFCPTRWLEWEAGHANNP